MPAIHQFVAGFANGDAISNEAIALRTVFRSWGFRSDIFCEARRILPELRREARDVSAYIPAQEAGDVVVLHLSIGSPVNEAFAALRTRRAILYHNVTPPAYFATVNPQTAAFLERAQAQIRRLAEVAEVNLADSRFNARELEALGYARVSVFPIMLDMQRLDVRPDPATLRRLGDGVQNVVFVGRGAPNKKIEDAIKAFYFFRRHHAPDARFVHAGSFSGTESYRWILDAQVRNLGLARHAVQFLGAIPQSQLNAVYRTAAVFLCMSEHEGFCIPLLEAMHHGVPVLAFDAGAVGETLDGAGVRVARKEYPELAELMARLTADSALRAAILEGQRARMARYAARDLAAEMRAHLAPLLS